MEASKHDRREIPPLPEGWSGPWEVDSHFCHDRIFGLHNGSREVFDDMHYLAAILNATQRDANEREK